MEHQRKYEEDRIAKNEEIELIMNDLERANHNYESAQKQIEYLQEQIKTSTSGSGVPLPVGTEISDQNNGSHPVETVSSSFETEINTKERELAQLTLELAKFEENHSVEVLSYQRQIAEISEKNKKISADMKAVESN